MSSPCSLPAAFHPKDFFVSFMTTNLEPDELLVEARFPQPKPWTGQAWVEMARPHGDFALVGVAAVLTLREDGVRDAARLVYTGLQRPRLRRIRAAPRSRTDASGAQKGPAAGGRGRQWRVGGPSG